VEILAARTWPGAHHAVVVIPDKQKGEQLVLVTDHVGAARGQLLEQARKDGVSEINVPRKIQVVKNVPVLGTGKTDYAGVQQLVANEWMA
jgi:acyl-[acyl-carrier-protein]-phospholipid O-acyltransferase/long-chain-fatty-acid--[acyl-carrier-protein] ligase